MPNTFKNSTLQAVGTTAVTISGSNKRKIIIYKIVDGNNVTVVNDAGILDSDKGTVTLHSFTGLTTDPIRVTLTPNSLEIFLANAISNNGYCSLISLISEFRSKVIKSNFSKSDNK